MNERAVFGQLAETQVNDLDTDELVLLLHGNITSREEDLGHYLRFDVRPECAAHEQPDPDHVALLSNCGSSSLLPTPAQMVQLRQRITGGINEFVEMTVAMTGGYDQRGARLRRRCARPWTRQPTCCRTTVFTPLARSSTVVTSSRCTTRTMIGCCCTGNGPHGTDPGAAGRDVRQVQLATTTNAKPT